MFVKIVALSSLLLLAACGLEVGHPTLTFPTPPGDLMTSPPALKAIKSTGG